MEGYAALWYTATCILFFHVLIRTEWLGLPAFLGETWSMDGEAIVLALLWSLMWPFFVIMLTAILTIRAVSKHVHALIRALYRLDD